MRPTKDENFMEIAQIISKRGECIRRKVGAVITSERGRILSTGYNGLGPGQISCLDKPCKGASKSCLDKPCKGASKESGTCLDECQASHAEISALVTLEKPFKAHTIYVTTEPCISCVKALLLTSIQRIIYSEEYPANGKALWLSNGREWIASRV